jgi:hypothetical protein
MVPASVTLSPTFQPFFLARASPTSAPCRSSNHACFSASLVLISLYTLSRLFGSVAIDAKKSCSFFMSLAPNQFA